MKTAIVCEGGGMRGVFTAGVLQAFMNNGFIADELVGVSAGASNGASYVSQQQGRGYRTNVDYCDDNRYSSWQSYLKTGSFFGMDFIFGEIPKNLDPFDYDAFYTSHTAYYAGVTDVETGRPVFFGKDDVDSELTVIRASCSLPILSPMVEYKGRFYLDGGISAPIPISKALNDGCNRLVVVLTRPRGYMKKHQSMQPVYHTVFRKYPQLIKALDLRHLVYNHTLNRLWRLEAQGKAIVVTPPEPLNVDRFGKNRDQLINAYQIGQECAKHALERI